MAENTEELETSESTEQNNALAMSDEDIMNMTEPPDSGENDGILLDSDASEQSPEGEGSEDLDPDIGGSDPTGDDSGHETDGTGGTGDSDSTDGGSDVGSGEQLEPEDSGDGSQENVATAPTGEEGKPDDKGKKDPETDPARTDEAVDPKAQLAQLFAPFKANGKQMQVSNVNDALTLMKMGANYNKKMNGLKPSLRMLKMLENNDLLDEEKISNLIDLSKKDPKAIAHLVKESGIDPIDIDTAKAEEYEPETYTVNDKDVELDAVLDDIRETSQFKDTMDIIGTKWDQKSRQSLYDEPDTIRTLNDHMGAGLFPQIMNIVENQRALGRLNKMSDIEAYQHVGDVIQANGGFDQLRNKQPSANENTPAPVAKPKKDPKLKSRKRAAAAPKGAPGSAPAEFNPLSMSDEDFEKVSGSQFV